jgi:hypothetical protein
MIRREEQRMMVSQFMTKKLIFEVLAMDSIVFWNVTK